MCVCVCVCVCVISIPLEQGKHRLPDENYSVRN